MGTRLYPITKNPQVIEKLAGVNPGTYEALDIFTRNPENEYTYDTTEEEYEDLCSRKPAGWRALEQFQTWGWNKFNGAALGVLKRWGLDREAGSTKNPIVVRALVTSMGIDLEGKGVKLEDLEGLVWY
jgi:hypothetical protein